MAQKKISEILKLVEFLNGEVREVSKRLSRVTPREVTEKLGTLALLPPLAFRQKKRYDLLNITYK